MTKDDNQLPAVLDLEAATPLHQFLLSKRGSDLQISGAKVQRLGAQCLQVLIAAQTAWVADGKTLCITDASTEFAEAVALFGLDDPASVFGQEQHR